MSGSLKKRRFELEELEPRLLLSAAPLPSAAASLGLLTPIASCATAQSQAQLMNQSSEVISYNSAANAVNILDVGSAPSGGGSTGADSQGNSTGPGESASQAGQVQNVATSPTSQSSSQQAATAVAAPSTSGQQLDTSTVATSTPASSGAQGATITQQLTDTLTAANGPPDASAPTPGAGGSGSTITFSFRSGSAINSPVVDHFVLGDPVYLRVDAPGMSNGSMVNAFLTVTPFLGSSTTTPRFFIINPQGYGTIRLTLTGTTVTNLAGGYCQLQDLASNPTVTSPTVRITAGPSVIAKDPPGVVSASLASLSVNTPGINYIDLTFDAPMDTGSFNRNVSLVKDGQDISVGILSVSLPDLNNPNVVRINFASPLLTTGIYTLTVKSAVTDINNNSMDQNQDGTHTTFVTTITVQPSFSAGVTVITHGFSLSGTMPLWTFGMADAILDRAAGVTAEGSAYASAEASADGNPDLTPLPYGTELVYDPSTISSITGTHWRPPNPLTESAHINTYASDQEIVLIYDWASVSKLGVLTGSDGGAYLQSAADDLFAALFDTDLPFGLNGRNLTDYAYSDAGNSATGNSAVLNFHFIGHSRGAVLNDLVVGEYDDEFGDNLMIEQVTSLDPHAAAGPLGTGVGDPWSTGIAGLSTGDLPDSDGHVLPTFANVVYADNYYQDYGPFYEPIDGNFAGIPVSGAYNLNLNLIDTHDDLTLNGPGYNPISGLDHSDIHLWYFSTILPSLTGILEDSSDSNSKITAQLKSEWFDATTGSPTATGFALSQVADGQGLRAALVPNLIETVSGISTGPSLKITASTAYMPGYANIGSPLNPTTDGGIYNGDFDAVGDSGTFVPAWYYSLSDPTNNMDVGNGVFDTTLGLKQTDANSTATHNQFYIPAAAIELQFSVEADVTLPNTTTTLTVWIDSTQIGDSIDLSSIQHSPNEMVALTANLRGSSHSLTFKITNGFSGDVFIDDIKLVVPSITLTQAQQNNQQFLISQSAKAVDGLGVVIAGLSAANQNFIPIGGSNSTYSLNSTLGNSALGSVAPSVPSNNVTALQSDLSDYFNFQGALNAYFGSGTPTLDGMIAVMNGQASALVGSLGQGIGGDPPFLITAAYDVDGNISFEVSVNVSKTRQIPIALSQLGQGAGISSSSGIMVNETTALQLSFSFGMDGSGRAFYTLHSLKITINDPDTDIGAPINIGSLAANIDQGTSNLAAEFDVTVNGGNEVTDFSNVPTPVVTTQTTTPLDIELPVTDSVGNFSQAVGDGAKISITDADVFSGSAPVVTISPALQKVLPFANLNIGQVLAQIQQFSNWLVQFRDSPLFNVQIPFTNGTTLGNAVDFATSFENQFFSQFVSLNMAASSPTQSVQNTGRLTADANFSLTIGTGAAVNITLAASATQNNSDLGDLAQDFNTQFAASSLNGKIQASVINGALTFVLAPGQGTSLLLSAASASDPIITQVGFTDQQNGMDTPAFNNIQGFINILTQVMHNVAPSINVTPVFDPISDQLTLQVGFTVTPLNATTSFSVNPNLPLGNLLNLSASGTLGITGSVTVAFTLGYSFQATSLPVLMSSLVVPAPANGRLSADSNFSLQLNTDAPISLALSKLVTANDNSVDDLAAALNALFATTMVPDAQNPSNMVALSSEIKAYRPDASSNRIAFEPLAAELGKINAISFYAANTDPMVTEVGFSNQQVAHSGATGLFIANSTGNLLSGTLTLSATNLSASARLFDFIDVTASGGTANISATFGVGLSGGPLYLSQLFSAIESTSTPGITFTFSGSASAALTTIQLNAPLSLTVPGGFSINIPDITNLNAYDASSNPNGITVTYPSLGALADFNGTGFAAILQALQIISGSLGQLSSFSFLNDPLPLIGKSVNDLIDYASKFKTLVNDLANNPAQTLQEFITDLNTEIDQVFNLNPGVLTISLDTNGPTGGNGNPFMALKFDLKLSLASAESLPFQLNLRQLVAQLGNTNPTIASILSAATSLVQADASGTLTVSLGATLNLAFGIDITDPNNISPFFYDGASGTGIALTAKVTGTNLNFSIALGSLLSLSINNGSAALSADGNPSSAPASISLALSDPGGTGRLYFSSGWLSTSNLQLTIAGGVSATLPLFLSGLPLGGSTFVNGYPGNDLVLQIPDLLRFFTGSDTFQSSNHKVTLLIPGTDNDIQISAANDFTVVLTDGTPGDTSNTTTTTYDSGTKTLTVVINSDYTTAATVINAIGSVSGFTASNVSNNSGAGTVTTARVFVQTPDFSSLLDNIDFGDLLFSQTGVLLNGLDSLLGDIEDGLNTLVLNARLPLVGNGLSKAADFIQDFRSGLLAQLRSEVAAAGGNGLVALKAAIQKALWESLGPTGPLNILVNPITHAAFADQSAAGYSQLDVELSSSSGLFVNLELKKTLSLVNTTANPINLDLGVPGFGLTTTGNVIVQVGFDMMFGFGVDQQDGFYFKTSASAPELNIGFSVTIPGLHFTGSLAFLQLDIADDSTAPSFFTGGFSVFLMDPGNTGKLTGAELLGGVSLSDIIQATLSAQAKVNLVLVASFGGDAAFPSVQADFHLRWMVGAGGSSDPTIWFDNVGLDLGSFVSGFLGSILKEIQQVTEPIEPILDLVTARIPILSDLAGETVTMLTLAEDFGYLSSSTVDFINDVDQVVKLINDIKTLGSGDIIIPFGAFTLSTDNSGQYQSITPMGSTPNNINLSNSTQSAGEQFNQFADDLSNTKNFDIPIFDKPSLLFNLFIGKPVTLIQWQLPEFKFQFSYTDSFPIYPPLFVQFGGSVEADINLGFAYDTYGIQEFFKDPSRNPADLLDGFYIITTDANGKSQAALTLTGQVFAGASLDLGIASGGVNGGLQATVSFFWNDNTDNDGKMRFSEIAADAAEGASCIFDIQGSISVFLQAFVDVNLGFVSIHKTWDLGDFTLVDFSVTCPQPVLGSVTSGVLTLNIGTLANQRLVGDTSDDSESFLVRDAGSTNAGETIDVTFDNHMEQFTGVKSIYVENTGAGNNVVDCRGVAVRETVSGGTGNDTFYLSDGAGSVVYCGYGNDTVIASSAASATGVTVYGGLGNDTIIAGTVGITIFGGAGNNVIRGSSVSDTIYGGGGNDTIYGDGGNDVIVAGPGHSVIYAASGASDGNNFILGDSWLLVMGDIGNVSGLITALSTGSDSLSTFLWSQFSSSAKGLLANPKATITAKEATLVQELDAVMLAGSLGTYFSDSATAAFIAANPNPEGQILVDLNRAILTDSATYGAFVKPRLAGGGDTIYVSSMGDVIDGGIGNNIVYGGVGNDLLIGGLGSVQEFGNAGNDLLIGAEVSSINGISVLPANITQLLGAVNNMGGTALNGITLHGLAGGGNDLLVGGGGSDVIFGGAGNDTIYGGNLLITGNTAPFSPDGNNFISGGTGNDVIFTDDAAAAATNPNPSGISIKSSIWFDANGNGVHDSNETGFAGVSVALWLASKPPGVSGNQALGSVVTDVNGNFEFDGLDATSYLLVFSLPNGMHFTTQSAVAVTQASNDSDASTTVATLGQTGVFSLSAHQTLTSVSAGYTTAGPAIVSISDASVTEGTSGQTPMVFTVTLSNAQTLPVQVTYQTLDGNDSNPLLDATVAAGDYVPVVLQTITFNPGETSKQITVMVNGSTTFALNASFHVQIVSARLMVPHAPLSLVFNATPATGTIINPNPIPTISISSFDPGDNSTLSTSDILNVSDLINRLVAQSDLASSYLWSQFSPATRAALTTGTLSQQESALLPALNQILQTPNLASGDNPFADAVIAAGTHLSLETRYLLTQNLQGNGLVEVNRLLLDDAYSTQIGGIAGTEGMPVTLTVTLSNPSKQTITVDWQTDMALTTQGLPQDGAAMPYPTANANYYAATGTLTFLPGVTNMVITVQTLDNHLDQADTHFYVDLSNPSFAKIDQGRGFCLIRNLDPPVTVSFVPVSGPNLFQTDVSADPNTPEVFYFNVQLLSSDGQAVMASGKEVSVNYSTSPGTAVENTASASALADYVGASSTLVFEPGVTSLTIAIQVNPRAVSATDSPINFFVNLTSATNATVAANPQGYIPIPSSPKESNHMVVVIHNPTQNTSAGPWSVAFSSLNFDVTEPDSMTGETTATITLVRTPDSTNAVVVFYTGDGTATAGVDYGAVRQIVQFAPDELTKTVSISIYNDGQVDGDETVKLYLRNPAGGPTLAQPNSATLTIHDPNPPAVYVLAPVMVAGSPAIYGMPEGDLGIVYYNFTVNLRGSNPSNPPTAGPDGVTVYYQTVDLTGVAGVDYVAASGYVTILAGQSSANISIGVIGNTVAQLNRTFGLLISQPAHATLASTDNFAVATIFDDDKATITGTVFYDANNNGFQDQSELGAGLAGVQVDITSESGGVSVTQTVTTDAYGFFSAPVEFGPVNIKVNGETVKSPYALNGQGAAYTNTTNNETQTVDFEGLLGLPTFTAVGYHVTNSPASVDTTNSKDLGTGHTDTTVFGGPGDDKITLGSGNDHLVGGSWMTATDANAPINRGSYDATILAAADNTPGANGPLWSVQVPSLSAEGTIMGTVKNSSGSPIAGQVVTLFDTGGDPVNSVVTDSTGSYAFTGLFFSANAPGSYVIQFTPPVGDTLVLSGTANVQVNGGTKTTAVTVNSSTALEIDATYQPLSSVPTANSSGFEFGAPGYRIAEDVQGGMLAITIVRTDASLDRAIVLQTEDGTATHGVNYGGVSLLVEFAVGVITQTVDIPIINTMSIGFAGTPLTFTLMMREPTGKPIDQATVYVGGDGFGHLTDDDTIYGGSGSSIIIGDSGNITAAAVYNYGSAPTGVTYVGGPGKDTIYAGSGATFVNGQLDDDTIYGGGDQQTLMGDQGNDLIYAGTGNEMIDGGAGFNTIASNLDVATIALASTSPIAPNSGTLIFSDSTAAILGTASFMNIQSAQLVGGLNANTFDLTGWENSAVVVGGGGNDILNVRNDSNMTLRNPTAPENAQFSPLYGVAEEGVLSLAGGPTYMFAGIANVWLTGGPGNDTLDASAYSGAVTFYSSSGNDTMIGGSGNDTFSFDLDLPQGMDTVTGNGGTDTLDFSHTLTIGVTIDLSVLGSFQTVGANLKLNLTDQIENVIGTPGDDTITGNSLNNVIDAGTGNNVLSGGAGSDTFLLNADVPNGFTTFDTITGGGGGDTLDFSATVTSNLTVNMSILGGTSQNVNASGSFKLKLMDNIQNVIGGRANDTLIGNTLDNTFIGGPGHNSITGGGGNDTVEATGINTFTLTNTTLAVDSTETDNLSGIQNAILNATGGNDVFDVTGWSLGNATLNGNGNNNTVKANVIDGLATLTNNTLTFGNPSPTVISLSSIENAILDATGNNDVFDLTAAALDTVTLNGIGHNNTVKAQVIDELITLTNASVTFGSPSHDTIFLNSIQNAVLDATSANDTFDLTGWTLGNVTLNGSGNNNTVVVQSVNGLISLTGTGITFGSPSTTTVSFISIQNFILEGSAGNDRFVLNPALVNKSVTVLGNGGSDTLDFSAFIATSITVDLSDAASQIIDSNGLQLTLPNTDVDNIIGAPAGGTISGNAHNDTFTITGGSNTVNGNVLSANNTIDVTANSNFILTANSLNVDGTGSSFSNIQSVNVTGGSSNTMFEVDGFAGTVSILGGPGVNTLASSGGTNFALTSASLTVDLAQIRFANVQNVTLTGGSSGDDTFSFNLAGWPSGIVTLKGGAAASSNYFTLLPQAGSNPPQVTVNVTGGGGTNTLDVSAFTGVTSSLSQMPSTITLNVGGIQIFKYDPPGPVAQSSNSAPSNSFRDSLNLTNALRDISRKSDGFSAFVSAKDYSISGRPDFLDDVGGDLKEGFSDPVISAFEVGNGDEARHAASLSSLPNHQNKARRL